MSKLSGFAAAWLAVGCVLLAASVAQPIVSSQLQGLDLAQMMQPPAIGGYAPPPLPPGMEVMFTGVLLNIEFALAFAAVKLVLGAAIVWAALRIDRGDRPARRVLTVASWIGIAAFATVAAVFAGTILVAATGVSVGTAIGYVVVAALGGAMAAAPILILRRSLRTLRSA